MATYTLKVSFSQDALNQLHQSGAETVLGKPGSGGGAANVAWIAFQPLAFNTITWEEQYGIYASHTQVQPGATLVPMTQMPARPGESYPFAGQNFGPPQGPGQPGAITIDNQSMTPCTFGLSQGATVNGQRLSTGPASGAGVFPHSRGLFEASSTAYIWVQRGVRSGQVVAPGASPQTRIDFAGGTEVSVAYDPATGQFVRQ